jgi:serine/threonine protein kinase
MKERKNSCGVLVGMEKFEINNKTLIHKTISTTIFQIKNQETKKDSILKLPSQKFPPDSTLENFRKEYQFSKILYNKFPEHFVEVIELLETESSIAIVLEPEGLSLEKIIANNGPFDIKKFLETAIDITECLTKLHSMNIIHRDLCSSNIVQTKSNKCKIIDFGVAIMVSRKSPSVYCSNPVGTFTHMR